MMFHEQTLEQTSHQGNKSDLHPEFRGGVVVDSEPSRLEAPQPPPPGCLHPEAGQQKRTSQSKCQRSPLKYSMIKPGKRCRLPGRSTTIRAKLIDNSTSNDDHRMISETKRIIYSTIETNTNLLLDARATSTTIYNHNISLMRSFLIHYLKLTLCPCYDTVALASLLVFVLLLNSFIEAHQHHQAQHHGSQTTTRRMAGACVGQSYWWNKTAKSRSDQPTRMSGSVAATSNSKYLRFRRSIVESLALAAPFSAELLHEDHHQRPLFDLDDEDGESSSRADIVLSPAASKLVPLKAFEQSEPIGRGDQLEISRVAASMNPLAVRSNHYKLAPPDNKNSNSNNNKVTLPARGKLEAGVVAHNQDKIPDRLNRSPDELSGTIRNGSHVRRKQQVSSAAPNLLDLNDRQAKGVADAIDRVPDWSFRQAAPEPAQPAAGSTIMATTSTTKRPHRNDQNRTQVSSRPLLEMGESHWIPVTRMMTSNVDSEPIRTELERLPAIVPASSHASSALLDYPPHMDGQVRRPPNISLLPTAPAVSASREHRPGRPNRQELQQLSSHVYGSRNPFVEFRPPPPPAHRPALVSNYEHLELENHQIHHANHHRHHQFHHWPRRRPRFQGELDNEIEPPLASMRPTKIYKRVLLCDKTLVSLDYVRNLNLEPRPSQAGGQLLNEHEINEINDNFLDLEANVDASMARMGTDSNADDNVRRRLATATNSTNAGGGRLSSSPPNTNNSATSSSVKAERLSTNDTLRSDQLAVPSMAMERRLWRDSLLSDEDPLVRCDMWDLEKGLKSRKPPEAILRMAIKADFDTVRDAINRCRHLSEKMLPPDDEYRDGLDIMSTEDLISLFSMKRGLMPGTKWCGLGDQANSYNDLGPKHRIDICCRAHDHCPIRSKPFRNDYGILNIGLYTKSHCDCDADFYRCLREVRSRTADMLGNLYFNVMKLQCMREERLKVCREMKPIALGFERCVRYEDSPVKTVFKFTTPPVAY